MDPRKLLYLVSVIEHGSFKKAAKHLLISQPALSTSMDRLESSLGEKLLDRSPTGVVPTSLGELLYSHAQLIRDEMALAERQIRCINDREAGAITFGTLPSLATNVVPTALCRWRQQHPNRLLKVVEKYQWELLVGLIRGELDFIIAQTECYDFLDGLRQRVLFRDRLCVMGRPTHPAFRMKSYSWNDLVEFPWILPTVSRQRTVLEKLLTSVGVDLPRQLTECGSVDFMKSLLVESDHLALLPAHTVALDVSEGRLKPLDITVPQLNRNIAVLFRERSNLEPASRDLVAQIEAAAAALIQDHTKPHCEKLSA